MYRAGIYTETKEYKKYLNCAAIYIDTQIFQYLKFLFTLVTEDEGKNDG